MKKKTFSVPVVFLTGAEVPGEGSGAGDIGDLGLKPVPMSFEEWLQSRWIGEFDENPGVDFDDYAKWFSANGFGTLTWDNFNPGVANDNEAK